MGKQRHGKVAKHGIVPVCLKGHTLSSTPPWQREWTTVVRSEISIKGLRMQEDRKRTQPDKEVRYHEGQQESEVAVASAGGETLSKATSVGYPAEFPGEAYTVAWIQSHQWNS